MTSLVILFTAFREVFLVVPLGMFDGLCNMQLVFAEFLCANNLISLDCRETNLYLNRSRRE